METKQHLPKKLCEHWGVNAYSLLISSSNAIIFRVRLLSGEENIIKQCILSPKEIKQSVSYLEWQDGIGCVSLLRNMGSYLMLEDAGDEPLSARITGVDGRFSLETAAHVIVNMHQQNAPFLGKLPTLYDLYQPLQKALNFKSFKLNEGGLFALYREACNKLSEGLEPLKQRPLHGDIHFDNIMRAKRGWIAIDPHGYFGHPAFDYANLFYNPRNKSDITNNIDRIRHACLIFSQQSSLTCTSILHYAFLYGCLSAFWSRQDGEKNMEKAILETAYVIFEELLSLS